MSFHLSGQENEIKPNFKLNFPEALDAKWIQSLIPHLITGSNKQYHIWWDQLKTKKSHSAQPNTKYIERKLVEPAESFLLFYFFIFLWRSMNFLVSCFKNRNIH